MKPSTFFAVFIPILSIILTTLFIILTANKKPDPRVVKIGLIVLSAGLLTAVFVFLGVTA